MGLLILLAIALDPLRYEGHGLGETVDQWEASTHFFAQKAIECEGAKRRKAQQCSEWAALRQQQAFHVTTTTGDKSREITWHFSRSSLTAIVVSMPPLVYGARWPDLEREAQLLVDSFGKPNETYTVPYRNGYGAQFDAEAARWTREDGSVIAFETGYAPGSRGSATRTVTITFATAEAVQQAEKDRRAGPNPYK